MSPLSSALHHVIFASSAAEHLRFRLRGGRLEAEQKRRLREVLQSAGQGAYHRGQGWDRITSYEEFRQRVPLSRYADWQPLITADRERKAGNMPPCERYQPTSGSTSARKWVPYSRAYLAEINRAISVWMHELYRAYPGIRGGKHYWSLSWFPTELRAQLSENSDLQHLPWLKRAVLSRVQAVPDELAFLASSDDSKVATLAYLAAAEDLSFISVWSPTFLLEMLKSLARERVRLAEVLATGRWELAVKAPRSARQAEKLRRWNGTVSAEFLNAFWPRLALVSAWSTSTSKDFFEQLQKLFTRAAFQGKGLFATEGVVTLPFSDTYLLSYSSHFYEFHKSDGSVIPAWELKRGDVVKPILSSGNGLLRYQMEDLIEVRGFVNGVPDLCFLGREATSDLVGEKLSYQSLGEMAGACARGSFFLSIGDRPRYVLVCDASPAAGTSERLERMLLEHFHYRLARELGQLGESAILVAPAGALRLYLDLCQKRGMLEGDVKVQPVLRISEAELAGLAGGGR